MGSASECRAGGPPLWVLQKTARRSAKLTTEPKIFPRCGNSLYLLTQHLSNFLSIFIILKIKFPLNYLKLSINTFLNMRLISIYYYNFNHSRPEISCITLNNVFFTVLIPLNSQFCFRSNPCTHYPPFSQLHCRILLFSFHFIYKFCIWITLFQILLFTLN